jgi:protein-tyrosine phosphatase
MKSAINFRDFGGDLSRNGGKVRKDQLYRCGHLATIVPGDIEQLLELDFAVIADLRHARERETDRSPWPISYAPRVLAHGGSRSSEAPHVEMLKWIRTGETSMRPRTIAFYRKLPFNRHYRPLFGNILARLAATDGRALIHCTAGKDRTGILAALILHALGVSIEAIIADYMRSGQSQRLRDMAVAVAERVSDELGAERAAALVSQMYGVEEDYLIAAFEAIEEECGSLDTYLETLGLTPTLATTLRVRLLV